MIQGLYVTRKGAIRAGKGELGIIPGSMGARSYSGCACFAVRGLGNQDSFESAAHGAGRRMSRTEPDGPVSRIERHMTELADAMDKSVR